MLCSTLPARISGNNPGSLPQDDNDIYKAKRKEALQKYEMLVNTQKKKFLAVIFLRMDLMFLFVFQFG